MSREKAEARCCREWWRQADRIASVVEQMLGLDYTASQTAAYRQVVFWSGDRAVLTLRVYAPWHANGARRERVVEFSGGNVTQYWTSYNENNWRRVERIMEQMREAAR